MLLSHILLNPPISNAPTSVALSKSVMRRGSGGKNGHAPIAFATTLDKHIATKSCTIVGTVDGSVGVLVPLDEKMYRRLLLLQQLMCMGVRTHCSLSPRDYRQVKTARVRLETRRGVLDGTLLWKYASLSTVMQDELALAMGTSSDVILENLSRIDFLCCFF